MIVTNVFSGTPSRQPNGDNPPTVYPRKLMERQHVDLSAFRASMPERSYGPVVESFLFETRSLRPTRSLPPLPLECIASFWGTCLPRTQWRSCRIDARGEVVSLSGGAQDYCGWSRTQPQFPLGANRIELEHRPVGVIRANRLRLTVAETRCEGNQTTTVHELLDTLARVLAARVLRNFGYDDLVEVVLR